jgi:hypothetical protein
MSAFADLSNAAMIGQQDGFDHRQTRANNSNPSALSFAMDAGVNRRPTLAASAVHKA